MHSRDVNKHQMLKRRRGGGRSANVWLLISAIIILIVSTLAITLTSASSNASQPDVGSGVIAEQLDGNYAYVSSLTCESISSGTAPFDTDDTAGNDSTKDNLIIRSWDTATYDFEYATTAKSDSPYSYFKNARVGFRFILAIADKEIAEFDLSSMAWVDTTPGYEASISNEMIDGVECQVLTAYRRLEPSATTPTVIPGTGTVSCFISVGMAANGTSIPLKVEAFTEHNEPDEYASVDADELVVSAAPRYNVAVAAVSNAFGNGTYDFGTGNESACNKQYGKVKGNWYRFAVMLQLRNTDTSKGLKGIEIPAGDITFDLKLTSTITNANGITDAAIDDEFKPLLFEYTDGSSTTGIFGRSVLSETQSVGYIHSAPANHRYSDTYDEDYCYNGGTHSAVIEDANNYQTIHMTVSGYEIVREWFPSRNRPKSDYVNPIYKDTAGNVLVGVFASGLISVVQPTYSLTDGEYVCDYYGTSSSDITVHISDSNLMATSISGVQLQQSDGTSNQTKTNDDNAAQTRNAKISGTWDQHVGFSLRRLDGGPNSTGLSMSGTDGKTYKDNWSDGTDNALIGDNANLTAKVFVDNTPMSLENDVAFDISLLKIDTNKLRIHDGSVPRVIADCGVLASDLKYRWAMKPDGSGWSNDQELIETTPEQLVYFDTLEEIEQAGGKCVGILGMTAYGSQSTADRMQRHYTGFRIDIDIIADADNINTTTIVVSESGTWKRSDVTDLTGASGADLDGWTDSDWNTFARNLELPSDGNTLPLVDNSLAYEGIKASWTSTLPRTYVPAHYDENGYSGGHTGRWSYGDTLLIKGEDTNVSVVTEQVENDSSKKIYDIDYHQRYADYIIRPSFGQAFTSTEASGLMTDVTIDITLPKGLRYVINSSYLGGTYEERTPDMGNVTGGAVPDVDVIENSDGTTTLTYRFRNVESGSELPPIHMSAEIGDQGDPDNDVVNNQQLTVTAKITSTYDISAQRDLYGNVSNYTIKVSKLRSSALGITVDPIVDDVDGSYTFTNRISNSAMTAESDVYAVGIMPTTSNGKSSYSGTYDITGMRLLNEHISDMSDITVYVTDNTAYFDKLPTDVPLDEIRSSWVVASFDASAGVVSLPSGMEHATAFAIVDASLASDEGMYVEVDIDTHGNTGGDRYCCLWGDAFNYVEASALVVNRTISGVAWFDDGDGVRSESETQRISGIKVSLVDTNGDVVQLIGGGTATTTTGNDGSYIFENVPAGDVFVRFDANGKKCLSVPKDAGDDDTIDSDAKMTDAVDGMFESGITDAIAMPAAETLYVTHYGVENIDLGLTEMKPEISLTKDVDREELTGDDVVVGARLTYSFTITNTGTVALTNVILSDHLDGIEDVSIDWDASSDAATGDGTLSAGETVSATATYSVTQDDIDAGKVINTATVTGEAPDGSEVSDDGDATTTIEYAPSIEIIKDVDKAQLTGDDAVVGAILRYTMTVVNTGNVTLHDVHITDELVHDSVTFDWDSSTVAETSTGILVPGEKVTATATYAVTQDDIEDAFVLNEATVHGTSPNDDDVSDTDDARTDIEHAPAIAIVKDVDKAMLEGDEAVAGMTLTYSFTITNTGNVMLSDVKLEDRLNGIYDLAIDWAKSSDDATDAGVLSVGETVPAMGKYDVTQVDVDSAVVTNTADVSGKSPQNDTVTDSDDAATTIEHSPSISLRKDVDKETLTGDAAVVGTTLTYDFVITNDGNVTLHDVELVDRLAGVYDLTIDWSKSSNADTGDGVLSVGETVPATAKYDITQSDIDAGKVANVADASGVSPQDETVTDDDDATTSIEQSPRISLDKSTPQANIGNAAAGRTVSFTFEITNTGNVTLHDITLTDHLDDIYDVVIDWTTSTDDVTDDGVLSVGESVGGTAKYDLTQADIDKGSVINTATTEGTSPLDEKVSDDDDVIIHLDAPSDIKLTKIVDIASLTGDDAVAGKILTYTFDIENTGETTLRDVRLVEHLHGMQGQGIDWSTHTDAMTGDGVLSPNEHVFGTMTYELTQADIDAGEINNSASVSAVSPHGEIYTSEDTAETTAETHQSLSLVKTASTNKVSGDDAVSGYEVEWFFELTNTGNVTLTDIDVEDYLDGTSDIDYGNWNRTLVPGASHVVAATYKLTQTDIDAGKVTNTAIAHSKSPDGVNVDSNESTVDVILDQSGGLTIEKHVDKAMLRGNEAVAGATLTYTFDVINAGNVTLHDVNIEDYLDSISDIAIDWDNSSDVSTGKGVLSPSEKVSATATYVVTQDDVDSGSVLNTAIAHGIDVNDSSVDSNESSVLTEIEQHTELLLDKQVDKEHIDPANVGDVMTYTFVITNKSNVTLTDLTMTDELDGISSIEFDWDSSTDDTTDTNTLSPDESITGTATYSITQTDIDTGKVTNTAVAHMMSAVGGNVDSNEDTVETTLAVEAVELTQSDDTNDGNVVSDVVETITETLSQTGIANGLKLVVLIAAGVASIAIWRKMRK